MNDFEIGGHMSKRHLFDVYFKIMSSQYIDKCHFHCRLGFNLQKKIEKENGVMMNDHLEHEKTLKHF